MSLSLVTAATQDPVTIDEAKAHCRVEGQLEDAQFLAWVKAATRAGEKLTNRQFCTATWRLSMESFGGWAFELRRCPVQSISSVTYVDLPGVTQTVSPASYMLDASCEPAIIQPIYLDFWPTDVRYEQASVKIDFVAGYGGPDDVPDTIKQAILLTVGSWYAGREVGEIPEAAKALFMIESMAMY